jgi:asparagine N-glycosylation enzyme membrane subunit Stt3
MQQVLSVNGVVDIVIKKILKKLLVVVVVVVVVIVIILLLLIERRRLIYNVNGVYNVIVKIVGFNIHEFIE